MSKLSTRIRDLASRAEDLDDFFENQASEVNCGSIERVLQDLERELEDLETEREEFDKEAEEEEADDSDEDEDEDEEADEG